MFNPVCPHMLCFIDVCFLLGNCFKDPAGQFRGPFPLWFACKASLKEIICLSTLTPYSLACLLCRFKSCTKKLIWATLHRSVGQNPTFITSQVKEHTFNGWNILNFIHPSIKEITNICSEYCGFWCICLTFTHSFILTILSRSKILYKITPRKNLKCFFFFYALINIQIRNHKTIYRRFTSSIEFVPPCSPSSSSFLSLPNRLQKVI